MACICVGFCTAVLCCFAYSCVKLDPVVQHAASPRDWPKVCRGLISALSLSFDGFLLKLKAIPGFIPGAECVNGLASNFCIMYKMLFIIFAIFWLFHILT